MSLLGLRQGSNLTGRSVVGRPRCTSFDGLQYGTVQYISSSIEGACYVSGALASGELPTSFSGVRSNRPLACTRLATRYSSPPRDRSNQPVCAQRVLTPDTHDRHNSRAGVASQDQSADVQPPEHPP